MGGKKERKERKKRKQGKEGSKERKEGREGKKGREGKEGKEDWFRTWRKSGRYEQLEGGRSEQKCLKHSGRKMALEAAVVDGKGRLFPGGPHGLLH